MSLSLAGLLLHAFVPNPGDVMEPVSPIALRVLHIDDNFVELKKVRTALEKSLADVTYTVESAQTVEAFRALLQTSQHDVVLVDVLLASGQAEGVALIEEIRTLRPDAVVIMRSNLADVDIVKTCIRSGADDFISKMSDQAEISLRIYQAWTLSCLKRGLPAVPDSISRKGSKPNLESSAVKSLHLGPTLERIALRVPLLIRSAVSAIHVVGESGTGKEVVADLFAAHRSSGPFVKVNCGGITPSLLESELFGHAKGSFTGALQERQGYIEEANGGWLFLDEVATLSLAAQTALLRVLESQEVVRVGESKPRKVSVRILSACNEPLEKLVAQGSFRLDLWQRLRETEIHLAPLRQRKHEIPLLVEHFCKIMPGGPYTLSRTALDLLCSHSWQDGNVRELRNCLRAMTEFAADKFLTPLSIPERFLRANNLEDSRRPDASQAGEASQLDGPKLTPSGRTSSLPIPALQTNGHVPAENDINLQFWKDTQRTQPFPYQVLEEQLFGECLRYLRQRHGEDLSVRRIGAALGLPKSTVARRLQKLNS